MTSEATIAQQINTVVDHLSEKLSLPAAHMLDVLVRQVYVQALTDVGVLALMTAVFFVALRYVRAWWDRWNATKHRMIDEPVGPVLVSVALGVFGIFVVIQAGCTIDSLTALINPEYAALRSLFEAVQ